MSTKFVLPLMLIVTACSASRSQTPSGKKRYDPIWQSLDTRPVPDWFDKAKFGIFLHWGVFSVPAVTNEWFWYNWKNGNAEAREFMVKNYPPDFTYADFGRDFHASFFNPNEWADIFKSSKADYIVLTSKHHEGYTMWPSKYSFNWNSMDLGPHRDLVGELATAIRNRTDIKFGLYHSMFEWYHPLYMEDKANGYETQLFPHAKALPELYEIVNRYQPEIIWSDGEWEASSDYWNSTSFIAWLYNDSPVKDTVVTNDRWGNETRCKHGDFLTCEDSFDPGQLINKKWENCLPVDTRSWGFRRDMDVWDVLSIQQIIAALTRAVSCGGNLLLNVGPTADGKIAPIFQERLQQIGKWLEINGESIFETDPWIHQNDTNNPNVWYTKDSNGSVYAIVLQAPSKMLTLGAPKFGKRTEVTVLGYNSTLKWTVDEAGLTNIKLPSRENLPDPAVWSYVLKITNLKNHPKENPHRLLRQPKEVLHLWKNDPTMPKNQIKVGV